MGVGQRPEVKFQKHPCGSGRGTSLSQSFSSLSWKKGKGSSNVAVYLFFYLNPLQTGHNIMSEKQILKFHSTGLLFPELVEWWSFLIQTLAMNSRLYEALKLWARSAEAGPPFLDCTHSHSVFWQWQRASS